MLGIASPKRPSFNTQGVRSPARDRKSFADNKAVLRSPQRRSIEDKATVMIKSPILLHMTPGERRSRNVTMEISSLELLNLGNNPISSVYCTLSIDRSQETSRFVSTLLTCQSKSGKVTYTFHQEENQLRGIPLMQNSVRVARLKIFAQGFDGELIGEATYPLGPFCAENTSTATMTILKNRKKVGEAQCTLIRPIEGYLDDSASEDADQASATPSPKLLTTGHIQSLQWQLQQKQQRPSVSLSFAAEHEVLIVPESSPLPPAVTASPLRSPRHRARSDHKSPDKKLMPSPFPPKPKIVEQLMPIVWRQQIIFVLAIIVMSVMSTLFASLAVKFAIPDRQQAPTTDYFPATLPVVDAKPKAPYIPDRVLQLSTGAMVEFRLLTNDARRSQCLTWLPSSSSLHANYAVRANKNNWFKELLSSWGRLLRGLMFWRNNKQYRPYSAGKSNNFKEVIVGVKSENKHGPRSFAVGTCGQSAAVWSVTGYDESAMTITPAFYQQDRDLVPKCLSIFGPSLATCMVEKDGHLNVSMQWILKDNILSPAVLKATAIEVRFDKDSTELPSAKPLSSLKVVAVIKSLTMVAASKQGQVRFEEREETFDSVVVK